MENNGTGRKWNPSHRCVCGWGWFQFGKRQETWPKHCRPPSHSWCARPMRGQYNNVLYNIWEWCEHTHYWPIQHPASPDVLGHPLQRSYPLEWERFEQTWLAKFCNCVGYYEHPPCKCHQGLVCCPPTDTDVVHSTIYSIPESKWQFIFWMDVESI